MTDFGYTIVVVPDHDDGGFYAYIPDLQGCMGDGDTPQDAIADVMNAAECWSMVRSEQGREMPAPGENERAIEAELKERDDYVASLESELIELRKKLRMNERTISVRRRAGVLKAKPGFHAA
mmetsp:Transcript_588/g.939  ORF Transcript_588/g.939 Transcript_588/m.939 type:complete len:122 (-) Transcript_588:575-940(-)